MKIELNEAAVFRWVLIVGIAAVAVIAVTLLIRPVVGALLGLLLIFVGCVYGYRWATQKRRELSTKK
ncbi:MAG TPA: hypothetical protein VF030_08535 [Solirubrobacterales bacterium]